MRKRLSVGLFLFLLLWCIAGLGFAQDATDASMSDKGDQSGQSSIPDTLKSTLDEGITTSEPQLNKGSVSGHSALGTVQGYQQVAAMAGGKNLSAVNPDLYRLEPGDNVLVEMWTPYHSKISGVISPLGTLNINPVGEILVRGVTVRQLSSSLESSLKKYYKDVQVSATLTEVRSVNVQVLGEVAIPGTYEMSGTLGALDAIGKAGGLTEKSSLRQIQLLKDNKPVQSLDYFKWRVFGDEHENPYLEPNETIYIPVIKNQVTITGEIRRPGTYEVRPGETFENLVEMAGGYSPEAVAEEVKISRIAKSNSKINLPVSKSLELTDGDSIYVPPLSLFEKKIKVIGEVNGIGLLNGSRNKAAANADTNQIGWYRLHENEKVRDVILNLGGLSPKADAAHARVERRDSQGILTITPVNLQKLFADNDQMQNLTLKDGDTLVVPAAASNVFVMGEVGRPGVVPYAPGNLVREYLALAGGPTSHSNLKHAKLIRQVEGSSQPKVYTLNLQDSLQGKTADSSVPVEPGDVIYVPRSEITGLQDAVNLISNYAILRALLHI